MLTPRIAFALACLVLVSQPLKAEEISHSGATEVNVLLVGGYNKLPSEWKPADDQSVFGLQTDFRPPEWPVNVAFGFLYGASPRKSVAIPAGGSVSSQSTTGSMDLGIRKYIHRESKWRPFVSGGVSLLRGEIETISPGTVNSDSGTGVGFWGSAGTLYVLGGWLSFGGQIRYGQGNVDINGSSFDAGGLGLHALIGATF